MKISRRTFLGVSAASLLAATGESIEAKIPKILKSEKNGDALKIKFLGTGSAGGRGKNGLGRRHSSILVDDGFLIDFTAESTDMIPEGVHPEIIFYTHSHKDHFNAADAIALGIKKVYLSHMSRSLHGSQAELDATLPAPLQAAHDGLEVVFTAPEE